MSKAYVSIKTHKKLTGDQDQVTLQIRVFKAACKQFSQSQCIQIVWCIGRVGTWLKVGFNVLVGGIHSGGLDQISCTNDQGLSLLLHIMPEVLMSNLEQRQCRLQDTWVRIRAGGQCICQQKTWDLPQGYIPVEGEAWLCWSDDQNLGSSPPFHVQAQREAL